MAVCLSVHRRKFVWQNIPKVLRYRAEIYTQNSYMKLWMFNFYNHTAMCCRTISPWTLQFFCLHVLTEKPVDIGPWNFIRVLLMTQGALSIGLYICNRIISLWTLFFYSNSIFFFFQGPWNVIHVFFLTHGGALFVCPSVCQSVYRIISPLTL